jgi:Flp pilus assembly protein TadG
VSRRQRAGERGQALIETAVVIAVILTIVMGVYAVSQFASDQNTAGTATRAAARLASELGNGGYTGSNAPALCQLGNPKDPCAVDRQIVQSVCEVAASMPFVTSIHEVDIYRATGSGLTGDLTDRYTSCAANAAPVSATYTLDFRIQTHPIEAYIGVSITYDYKSPLPLVPLTTRATVYTVTQMSPHFT